MDNNLKVFKNSKFGEIRVLQIGSEPWLVGKDVAEILQYKETHKAISRHVDKDDRIKHPVTDNLGRLQDTWIINESGFYSLVLSSEMKEAKEFKRWVTKKVLPSIRKHGAYMTPEKIEEVLTDPDTIIKLATQLKAEREEKKLLQQQAEENKPKVLFAEAVTASHTTILVGELAKLLRQNGIDTGQNRLFSWLRNNGYLIKRKGTDYNMPTQKAMDLGLFEVKETSITHSDGHISVSKTPKVTGKGQLYFINKFKEMDLEKVM
ncbi:phage antirepressor [Anaerosalibacter bizertensis]|uniref:phage antirepressor n=1 Tax=Anaerosalibacter bizertensis TaxID=932217 RepID=UPI001C0EE3AB|nr:phage antirepressor [Anaerosalibacter bizertensis]MBU5292789.1 phage antirepressor [Anaerosalibacter bizertensis]